MDTKFQLLVQSIQGDDINPNEMVVQSALEMLTYIRENYSEELGKPRGIIDRILHPDPPKEKIVEYLGVLHGEMTLGTKAGMAIPYRLLFRWLLRFLLLIV